MYTTLILSIKTLHQVINRVAITCIVYVYMTVVQTLTLYQIINLLSLDSGKKWELHCFHGYFKLG